MKQTDMTKLVYSLPENELRLLNTICVERLRAIIASRSAEARLRLYEGCRVEFIGAGDKLSKGETGTIRKIGSRNAKVNFDSRPHEIWTVALGALAPIEPLSAEAIIESISNG